jgi:hypothetical protein
MIKGLRKEDVQFQNLSGNFATISISAGGP